MKCIEIQNFSVNFTKLFATYFCFPFVVEGAEKDEKENNFTGKFFFYLILKAWIL